MIDSLSPDDFLVVLDWDLTVRLEQDDEVGAYLLFARYQDPAAERVNQVATDGQSKADARHIFVVLVVELAKILEQLVYVLLFDADACVAHDQSEINLGREEFALTALHLTCVGYLAVAGTQGA